MIRRLSFCFYALISLGTALTVILTGSGEFPQLLHYLTRENGPVESSSVVVLLLTAGYAASTLYKQKDRTAAPVELRGVLVLVGLAASIAALEEISWGQQMLGFRSSRFFLEHNLQRETNLHNLIPASISSAIINTTIYIGFIWLPCAIALAPQSSLARLVNASILQPILPSTRTMMIFTFGSTLQAYFLVPTWSDTAALVGTLLLLAMALHRDARSLPADKFHFAWICICTLIFVAHHDIFRFANMQYEIRELVVVLGCLHWLTDWPENLQPLANIDTAA